MAFVPLLVPGCACRRDLRVQGVRKTLRWFFQEFVPNSVGLGLVWFGFSEMVLQATQLHVVSLRWILPFPAARGVAWWDDYLEQARLAKVGNCCRSP